MKVGQPGFMWGGLGGILWPRAYRLGSSFIFSLLPNFFERGARWACGFLILPLSFCASWLLVIFHALWIRPATSCVAERAGGTRKAGLADCRSSGGGPAAQTGSWGGLMSATWEGASSSPLPLRRAIVIPGACRTAAKTLLISALGAIFSISRTAWVGEDVLTLFMTPVKLGS